MTTPNGPIAPISSKPTVVLVVSIEHTDSIFEAIAIVSSCSTDEIGRNIRIVHSKSHSGAVVRVQVYGLDSHEARSEVVCSAL